MLGIVVTPTLRLRDAYKRRGFLAAGCPEAGDLPCQIAFSPVSGEKATGRF